MPRYLFVCYNGGAGGEQLAQRISQLDKCYTLDYRMWNGRTINYNHLNDYQVLERGKPLLSTNLSEKYHVIPTHCRPEDVKYDGLKITINFPTDPVLVKELEDNCYNKLWCFNDMDFKNKMSEYTRHGEITQDVYDMLKDSTCTYGDIIQKAKGLNWKQWWNAYLEETFAYKTTGDVLAIEYIIPQPIEIIEQINNMI
tara:strand:- start:13453 stop:14046 length:594 start_codon:yes stop_codon:yes gene_type:complete